MRSKADFVLASSVTLALALVLGVLAWAQQPTQTRFDGMLARYNVTQPILDGVGNPIGSEYYYLYLAESMGTAGTGPVQVRQWRLNFTIRKTLYGMPTSQVQLTGSGPIPDNSVILGKPAQHKLALLVDIPSLPTPPSPMGYSRSKNWSPGPTPHPDIDMDLGIIDLRWERINDLWNRNEGHSVLDFGDYWQHSQGFTEENAALVWGFLFGMQISPMEFSYPPGRIGNTRSLMISHPK